MPNQHAPRIIRLMYRNPPVALRLGETQGGIEKNPLAVGDSHAAQGSAGIGCGNVGQYLAGLDEVHVYRWMWVTSRIPGCTRVCNPEVSLPSSVQ
jgi:hypothetical protein